MSQNAVERKQHIDKATPLSLVRQCELLEVHRSGLYYQPVPETTYNLELMRLIDEKHILHPWLGVPRMTQWLRLDKGYQVNHKRVERLYRLLGIQASGPKPNTSKPGKGHKIYPYLLRHLVIERLWRSVKYEHVYLFPASDGLECYQGLKRYFRYYNDERRHQSLEDQTPLTVFQPSEEIAA